MDHAEKKKRERRSLLLVQIIQFQISLDSKLTEHF